MEMLKSFLEAYKYFVYTALLLIAQCLICEIARRTDGVI